MLARTCTAIDAIPGPDGRAGGVDPITKAEALALLLAFADRLDVRSWQGRSPRPVPARPGRAARLAKAEEAQIELQGAYLVENPMTGMWHGQLDLAAVEGTFVHTVVETLAKPHPATDGTPDPRSAARRRPRPS